MATKQCPTCGGIGKVWDSVPIDKLTFGVYRRCPTCKGTGKIEGGVSKSLCKN